MFTKRESRLSSRMFLVPKERTSGDKYCTCHSNISSYGHEVSTWKLVKVLSIGYWFQYQRDNLSTIIRYMYMTDVIFSISSVIYVYSVSDKFNPCGNIRILPHSYPSEWLDCINWSVRRFSMSSTFQISDLYTNVGTLPFCGRGTSSWLFTQIILTKLWK